MIIGATSSWVVENGRDAAVARPFVREGEFVADGNGLMGMQVAEPSRGMVRMWEGLTRSKARGSGGRIHSVWTGESIIRPPTVIAHPKAGVCGKTVRGAISRSQAAAPRGISRGAGRKVTSGA